MLGFFVVFYTIGSYHTATAGIVLGCVGVGIAFGTDYFSKK